METRSKVGTLRDAIPLPTAPPRVGRHQRAYEALVAEGARLAGRLSRLSRLGSGSSIPGKVVERLAPGYTGHRVMDIEHGSILVSGTNGKTTTVGMLMNVLSDSGRKTVTNATGANLFSGIATTLLRMKGTCEFGLFETDEAAMPRVSRELKPMLVVLTNIFRDQLDRFGEPEHVAALLKEAVASLPADSVVVANANDPLLWHAVEEFDPVSFGVRGPSLAESNEADPMTCPACGDKPDYSSRTFAHLGTCRCPSCGWGTPEIDFEATVEIEDGMRGMTLELAGLTRSMKMGGMHNAYNAAAVVAAGSVLGISPEASLSSLTTLKPRFGRGEEFRSTDKSVWLMLMKNPGGASPAISQLASEPNLGSVLVCISDLAADGRDVSWIWDADFETLAGLDVHLVAGGRRATEAAVRFRYAGRAPDTVASETRAAVNTAIARCPPHRAVGILATYSSLLEIRQILQRSKRLRVIDQTEF